MIVSELIKIKKIEEVSTEYVETELKSKSIEPIRWAIVNIDDTNLTINVSYDKMLKNQ